MKIENKIILKLLDIIINSIDYFRIKSKINSLFLLNRFFISLRAKLIYIIEDNSWVINFVGKQIVDNLNRLKLINSNCDRRYFGKKKIIHFGSLHCLIKNNKIVKLNPTNKYILTIFHLSPHSDISKFIPYLNKFIYLIHTSNEITKTHLIKLGFNEEKIKIIPLGIDLQSFKRFDEKKRILLKIKFGLPLNKIIIGSFQKDGIGWGEGNEPKLIKGPDIFCEIVKLLNEKHNIHVLLIGPSRGYVKQKLNEYKVDYTHLRFVKSNEMVNCYNTLDIYLITSRIEGGPLSLLECMATGVPIITTNVGMAPELIKNGYNGFITNFDNTKNLYKFSLEVIQNKLLREKFVNNNLKIVQNFNWKNIAKQYYWNLYRDY